MMADGLTLEFWAKIRAEVAKNERWTGSPGPVAILKQFVHPPGVYFGMPVAEYRRDPSLGSTNIKDMRPNQRKYQRSSWMAERPVDTVTKSTVLGTALHMMVLEGIEKFSKAYVRRPESYNDLSQGDKTAMTKRIKAGLAMNQEMLSAEQYDLCVEAASMIVEHDSLRSSLTGGENEVSVFWVDEHTGVPCKARFDRLKARGIGDIKSIANEMQRPLEYAAGLHIKSFRYDKQAAHYLDATMQIPSFVKQGSIFHLDGLQAVNRLKLLDDVSSRIRAGDFGYQLIFVQTTGGAEVWSGILSPNNTLIKTAREEVHYALEAFNVALHHYGIKPWPASWKLSEIHQEDLGDFGWH
jgi:hypothetical protein